MTKTYTKWRNLSNLLKLSSLKWSETYAWARQRADSIDVRMF
jgi:hypothetical protein